MKSTVILIVLAALTSVASAQQSQQTPVDQALGEKLMAEINENVQLRTAVVQLQSQIADLKKQLETETAPKPPKPNKP